MSTIDELRGLVDRATPLPWKAQPDNFAPWVRGVAPRDYVVADCHSPYFSREHDQEAHANKNLIVAAVNALPALLAVAEAARKLVQHTADFDLETALARLDGEVGHG